MHSDCLENGVGRGPSHWGCGEAEMHVLPLRCSQLHVLGRVGGNWMCCSFCGWSSSGARAVKLTVFKMLNSYFFSLAAIVSPGPALSHWDSMCFVSHWAEADLSRVHLLCSCTEFAIPGPREALLCQSINTPFFAELVTNTGTKERQV